MVGTNYYQNSSKMSFRMTNIRKGVKTNFNDLFVFPLPAKKQWSLLNSAGCHSMPAAATPGSCILQLDIQSLLTKQ